MTGVAGGGAGFSGGVGGATTAATFLGGATALGGLGLLSLGFKAPFLLWFVYLGKCGRLPHIPREN